MAENQIPIPGQCTITTYGQITAETAQCWLEMRSFCESQGLKDVRWSMIPGTLVEKARNEAVRQLLNSNGQWLFMLDGDCIAGNDALIRLLTTAYVTHPFADVVGGYCNLRGEMGLTTIDTGTGTWEPWFPNSGVPEVMRTGAACLLCKRHVFERMKDPWFRMRVPHAPWISVMADFDNVARIKFDGTNPLRDANPEAWAKLEQCARQDPSAQPGQFIPVEVGEDSGFCDRVRLNGMRIFVNTEIVSGHVDKKITGWLDLKKHMDAAALQNRQLVGIQE